MSHLIKVAVLIKQKDTFLLVQEKSIRAFGLWNWPQGTPEAGESLKDTAIREAKEETGLDIQIKRKIKILNNTFADTKELHVYEGHCFGGVVNFPKDEILDVQYFTLEQIEDMSGQFVEGWIYEVICKNI
jgi:8-oxo-dGTP diphosphatase